MMYGALSTEVRNIHDKLGLMESTMSGLCSNMHTLTGVVLGATANGERSIQEILPWHEVQF